MAYLDFSTYKKIFSCASQYTILQERWKGLIVRQQEVVERIDKMNCCSEMKGFLMRKQKLEYDQHMAVINAPIHEYCNHSTKYMDTKQQMIKELNDVKTCDDIRQILSHVTMP